jgi:hypothetical protein
MRAAESAARDRLSYRSDFRRAPIGPARATGMEEVEHVTSLITPADSSAALGSSHE